MRPEPGAIDSVHDVSLLAFRVWAPCRDAAGVQHSLDENDSAPVMVEPLCGSLGGATGLAVSGIVALTLGALVIVLFRPAAS